MISNKVAKALNEQIELEAYASYLYLAMSAWSDAQGLSGSATFLRRQSAEEQVHMMKLFDYIIEVGGKPVVPAIAKPPESYKDAKVMFERIYEHEQEVTQAIHNLVDLAIAENDHSTHNFLQWYIEEQREEEDLMRTILDRINLIGEGPMTLYYIDKEVETINARKVPPG
jgi:ferritin